jgi:N-terminal acetyltransferase B complex non-catalytic subunit
MAEADRGELLQKSENEGKLVKCRWCSDLCEKSCQSCLRKLCEEALHAYGSSIKDDVEIVRDVLKSTDIHPADDWAIIAAMCLVKLAGRTPGSPGASQDSFSNIDPQELLQACAILEFAYSHSKANPGTLLLLVRLYSLLGAGSLAIRAFNRLGAKQIQLETLSYILLDRISSLHPHIVVDGSRASSEKLDPSQNLKKLQRLYKNAKRAIQTNVWKSFENQSYDSIFQFLEVSDTLSSSMVSAMSVIELRKISRVARDETMFDRTSHGYDILGRCYLRSGSFIL